MPRLAALRRPSPATACLPTAAHRLPAGRLWAWLSMLLILLAAGLALPSRANAQLAPASSASTAHVSAELLAYAPQGVAPGATVWLGVKLQHQPEWHTYWKNAGDSGLPTELTWTLPAGLSAGEIQWPLPRKFPIGPLANYGYDDTVVLPVPVTISPDFQPPPLGTLDIRLHASWLACRVECIPEEADLGLRLPVQGSTALHAQAFEQALASQPQALPNGPQQTITIQPDSKIGGKPEDKAGALEIVLDGLPADVVGQSLEFFTETPETIETGAPWQQQWAGTQWRAVVPLSAYRTASPAMLPIVLTVAGPDGRLRGWRAELPVHGEWPTVPQTALSPALTASPLSAAATTDAPATIAPVAIQAYALALLGALLGGLLLNLMPCVLPVLAIKVIGLSRQTPREVRLTGLAYAVGVIAAMLALAGLMLALRAGGESLGWGFQLQSPAVVAALALLFAVLGLNLAGLFEFAALVPDRWAGRQLQHPVANALLSGVLAVAVASPCTAPFMGASLGFTLTLPAGQTLLLFAVLGLGLALPFLAASLVPAAARLVPRPGHWMVTLRQFLAFPMFGTVAWLMWVLGQQSGIDGAAALAALLVCVALLLWALGRASRTRWLLGGLSMLVLLAAGTTLGPSIVRELPPQAASAQDTTGEAHGWQPWSPERERALLAEGRPVFIDYTAAWCITCQYNKRTTLADPQVLARFAATRTALLRADWTRRDAAITASLAALGRNGVPTYVVRRPDNPTPIVLPELLTRQAIENGVR